jgi:hypothetical protein
MLASSGFSRSYVNKGNHSMRTLKGSILAAVAVAALTLVPIASASASPFIVPWLLGRHAIGAVVGLATLPLAIASAAAGQPEGPYPAAPVYSGGPGYGGAPGYYPPAPVYYAPRSAYYPGTAGYYRPPGYSARPRFYEAPRGYAAPRARYTSGYGAHVPSRSGSFSYRRR